MIYMSSCGWMFHFSDAIYHCANLCIAITMSCSKNEFLLNIMYYEIFNIFFTKTRLSFFFSIVWHDSTQCRKSATRGMASQHLWTFEIRYLWGVYYLQVLYLHLMTSIFIMEWLKIKLGLFGGKILFSDRPPTCIWEIVPKNTDY